MEERFTEQEIYKTIIIVSIVLLLIVVFTVIYIAIFKRRELKLIRQNLKQKQEFDAALLETQIEIQEQTLKTISQEIHDNIGQVLSLIKLTLSTIITTDSETASKINNTKTLLGKAIIDLKDISNSLNTDSIEAIGLLKAIETEVELINKTNLSANLSVNGNAEKLHPKTELILFRMVQECLNNAIKHSQAKQINVLANFTNNYFELVIADNGIGFNTNNITSKGLGLKNMQNRVKFIAATLSIISNHSGTEVKITIPK